MTILPAILALVQGPTLDLDLMPSGLFDRIHGYMPFGLKLSADRPESLTKVPSAKDPRYGQIKIGSNAFAALLSGDQTLHVDSNGDGDLTNDPAAKWEKKRFANGSEGWQGSATVEVSYQGKKTPCAIGLYGTNQPDELGYYVDFALAGKATLAGKAYDVIYNDPSAEWSGKSGVLLIDKDGDGKFHPGFEFYRVNEPFNVGGTTYEMNGPALSKSAKSVAERTLENSAPPDPNLANGLVAGKPALAFQATTTNGRNVSFPKSYKGKVVLLDFWATWCGPCMQEVPNVVKAYEKYCERGFEVLGVSLDRENAADQIRTVAKKAGMEWDQIYDGKFFDARIAKQYGIKAIPATYLVDGDTGRILAAGQDARGAKLAVSIEKALAAKSGKK